MHRYRSRLGFAGMSLACALVGAQGSAADAAPLDAESCERLKLQRDALQAAGVRELLQQPPARAGQLAAERARQVRTLIDVDGQLRFRCMIDLPIATLKPEPVEEFVDAGDTAVSATTAKSPLAKRKAAAAKAAAAVAAKAAAAPVGTPVPQVPKTAAAIKTGSTPEKPAAEAAAPKAPSKPRPKADDAYRAPATGDANGTPLDKQAIKP